MSFLVGPAVLGDANHSQVLGSRIFGAGRTTRIVHLLAYLLNQPLRL